MKKTKDIIFIFIGLIFFALGVLASYAGIHTIKSVYNFFEKAEKTEAQIVDITITHTTRRINGKRKIETTKHVYVSYEIDGVAYEQVSLGGTPAFKDEGDMVTIYYNPGNPYEINTIAHMYFPIIPFLFAVAFLFAGYKI